MKRSLKILTFVVLLITIISLTGMVNAYTVTMNLTSSSKLKAGDTVDVVLKLGNVDAGDGIDTVKGTLVYDKEVFEEITTRNSLQGQGNWATNIYNTDNGMFTLSADVNSGRVKTGDVLKISFAVKDSISKDSATIAIKEISVAGGAGQETVDIDVSEVSVTVSKAEDTTPTPTPTPSTNTQTPGTTTPSTNKPASSTPSTTPKTTTSSTGAATGRIPQTGELSVALVVAAVAVVAVSVVTYVRYRKVSLK